MSLYTVKVAVKYEVEHELEADSSDEAERDAMAITMDGIPTLATIWSGNPYVMATVKVRQ